MTAAHFGAVDPATGKTPTNQVFCGAFLGPRTHAMVASLAIPSCGVSVGWAVFRDTGGAWQLVMKQDHGAFIAASGSDIRESQGVLAPGDPHCFPSSTRTRIWHWDGSKLVASAWKVTRTGGATTPPAATIPTPTGIAKSTFHQGGFTYGFFQTPSGNIECDFGYGKGTSYVRCGIKSGLKPPPPSRGPGCTVSNRVGLGTTGPPVTSRSICPGEDEGDAGPFAGGGKEGVLAYGKTWTGGGFSCTSAFTGLTCKSSKSGHGFFLSRANRRSF
jgi:hypothetical protein